MITAPCFIAFTVAAEINFGALEPGTHRADDEVGAAAKRFDCLRHGKHRAQPAALSPSSDRPPPALTCRLASNKEPIVWTDP